MLIFLSSLKQIPMELYEAASIDGANGFKRFWTVTLPLLTPTIFFNLVQQTINSFLAFTQSKQSHQRRSPGFDAVLYGVSVQQGVPRPGQEPDGLCLRAGVDHADHRFRRDPAAVQVPQQVGL